MDRDEKRKIRDHIGEHLDVSNARLTDDEAEFLGDFVDVYDDTYKGRVETRTSSYDGWSSAGKYTRQETFTYTFTDDLGIREDYSYKDDDGQSAYSASRSRTPEAS